MGDIKKKNSSIEWVQDGEYVDASVTNRPMKEVNENYEDLYDAVNKILEDDNGSIKIRGGTVVNGSFTIGGDLVVSGTTTKVNTTDTEIKDNIIELNADETGDGISKGSAGITINRGKYKPARLIFDESDDKWKMDYGDGTFHKLVDDSLNTLNGDTLLDKIKQVDGSGSGLDADKLDGKDSSQFLQWDDVKSASLSNSGWITIAKSSGSRGFADIFIVSNTSSYHDGLHLEWVRSFANSAVNIISYTAHGQAVDGIRILQEDGDETYGEKYLQIHLTAKLDIWVYMTNARKFYDYTSIGLVTPVVEDSKSGFSEYDRIRIKDLNIQDGLIATTGAIVADRMRLTSGDGNGIRFDSDRNWGSDYAEIKYLEDDDSYNKWGDSSENSALVIKVENDPETSVSDVVALEATAGIFLNAPAVIVGDKNGHPVITSNSKQALHPSDALRLSGSTLYLYKGDGSYESVSISSSSSCANKWCTKRTISISVQKFTDKYVVNNASCGRHFTHQFSGSASFDGSSNFSVYLRHSDYEDYSDCCSGSP